MTIVEYASFPLERVSSEYSELNGLLPNGEEIQSG